MARDSSGAGRLACLDGLRGIAIALVIAAHLLHSTLAMGTVHRGSAIGLVYYSYGGLGVTLFFVLSGYLITRLLVREEATTGAISLRHFYLRRVIRILPPLGLFLLVMAVCAAGGLISIPGRDFVSAGLFVSNFRVVGGGGQAPFLGHIWSLAIEEQFYLFWPACLVLAGFPRARRFATALIAAMPLIRIAHYFLFPATRHLIETRPEGCADRLMYGSLLALFEATPALQPLLRRALQSRVIPLLASLHFLVVSPLLTARFAGMYRLTVGISSEALAAAIVIAWVLQHPEAWLTSWLQSRVLTVLGALSYSLYLWQQPFLSLANEGSTGRFPANVLLCFAAATASHLLVERPLMALRRRHAGAFGASPPATGDQVAESRGRLPGPGALMVAPYATDGAPRDPSGNLGT